MCVCGLSVCKEGLFRLSVLVAVWQQINGGCGSSERTQLLPPAANDSRGNPKSTYYVTKAEEKTLTNLGHR